MVDGIARVYESELVLEFEVREGLFRIGSREVVIPFEEIESVALRRRGFLRNALLFSTRRLHPASSRAGQFELYVSPASTRTRPGRSSPCSPTAWPGGT